MSSAPADADGLLRLLRERGVTLSARGTALEFDAPAGVLTDDLIDAMRRLKPDILARLAGDADEVVCIAPASVAQARQFRLTVASDNPQTLTVAMRFALHGPLDHPALRRALTDLVARHPALRTRYAVHDGEVIQQVLAPRPQPLTVVDVTPERLDATIEDFCAAPFALETEPAYRALLARVNDPAAPHSRHELALAMHHGIIDGWSTEVLVRDLSELYRAALTGQPADLPPLAADFVDFCRWERDFLAAERTRDMVRAWADRVRAGTEPIRLPTDRPRSATRSSVGAYVTDSIPADLLDAVTRYAVRRNVTPFVVLAAAFAVLMQELTGWSTIPLTSSVANRTDPRFANVVGVFTQAPWLVVELRGTRTFDELVEGTAAAIWQMLAMQSVPAQVQSEALGEPFTGNPPRVYLTMLDMADPVLRLPGLAPAPARDVLLTGARGDQVWQLRPLEDGGLSLIIEYATSLFDAGTVARWAARYRSLLRHALTEPGAWPRSDQVGPHRPENP
ncbi:condensation domain-containing protein [Micromonospora sp. CPCC 206060]|uniref:condensation domain-containing protein n=1 Tax=Micromonospora sp. CPCC 206060 TaxID=3122406 RepID=UPI002FF23732